MPIVREATLEDGAALSEYLPPRLGGTAGGFRRLFEYQWPIAKPDIGMLIEDGGHIRGFVGGIYSQRRIAGRLQPFCNVHSFAVDAEYRRFSLLMLQRLLGSADCTYTCFSASPRALEIFKAFKFQIVDAAKVMFTPLAGLTRLLRPGVRLRRATEAVDDLDPGEREIVRDHGSYRCGQFILEADDQRCYFVTIRRGLRVRAFADVLYASNPSLLVSHVGHVHTAIARTHHTPLLGLDRRFVPRAPAGTFTYARIHPLAFRSSVLREEDLDALYSELVPMYG